MSYTHAKSASLCRRTHERHALFVDNGSCLRFRAQPSLANLWVCTRAFWRTIPVLAAGAVRRVYVSVSYHENNDCTRARRRDDDGNDASTRVHRDLLNFAACPRSANEILDWRVHDVTRVTHAKVDVVERRRASAQTRARVLRSSHSNRLATHRVRRRWWRRRRAARWEVR